MKRYHITSFGCQMNDHDTERIRGMLEDLGYSETPSTDETDILVINTCTIREKPDQRLYSLLQQVSARKDENGPIIAVGGCLVEAQQDRLFSHYPAVDVAFGPGRIDALAEYLVSADDRHIGFYGIEDERSFSADLPASRHRRAQAWVQISMGCNSVCSYCIVPQVRGREKSRPQDDVLREIRQLAGEGVTEITLLGQNVNSWGRDLPVDTRITFAELLREVDAIDGVERVRFTSPHPKDMREDVIAAMAECESVCEQLHLPFQSGSTRILKAMRRTYSRERFLNLVDRIRAAVPDMALSTDIIVGFPGETEEDFQETMSLVEEVGFDSAFTFIYSKRSGTRAADMDDQIPEDVKSERLERLIEVVRRTAQERLSRHIGETQMVLVEGQSKRDELQSTGRTRHNVRVNFPGTWNEGEYVPVLITETTSQTLKGTPVREPAMAGV